MTASEPVHSPSMPRPHARILPIVCMAEEGPAPLGSSVVPSLNLTKEFMEEESALDSLSVPLVMGETLFRGHSCQSTLYT